VGLRGRLKKLERAAEEEMIVIPQHDGTVKRFPQSEGADALLSLIDGRDHPLAEAARNSPDPEWANSFYIVFPIDENTEDLSEGGP
jgi:hypothetical protein